MSDGENFVFKPTKGEKARNYVQNQWNNVKYGNNYFVLTKAPSVN